MTDKTDNGNTTRLTALLGLAASKTTTTESCPSDQQLADFIQGHLKSKVQQRLLSHLNSCPDCRQAWLDTSAYMDTVALEQTAQSVKKTRGAWFSIFTQTSIDRFNSWPLVTAGLATTAILVTLLWPSRYLNQPLDQRISSGYQTLAIADQAELRLAVQTFTLPWDNAVMGFSPTGSDSQSQAFGAGLWSGKNQLLINTAERLPESLAPHDGQSWQSGQWAESYQLGRWMFLLWVETQRQAGNTDWAQHAETLQQLATQAKGELADSLQTIDTKLQSLITSENSVREQNQLRRLLETTMQQYALD